MQFDLVDIEGIEVVPFGYNRGVIIRIYGKLTQECWHKLESEIGITKERVVGYELHLNPADTKITGGA